MSYSDEVKAIETRLKAIESAINELRKEDLHIVKMTGNLIFLMEIRTAIKYLKGEDIKSFRERWDKKMDDAKKEISGAQTVATAFDIIRRFDKELAEYVRAEKIETADKAMEIAHSFIKKYSPVALPLRAIKEGNVWLVDVDVGALAVKVAKVKVDARTGDIISYEIPEKE